MRQGNVHQRDVHLMLAWLEFEFFHYGCVQIIVFIVSLLLVRRIVVSLLPAQLKHGRLVFAHLEIILVHLLKLFVNVGVLKKAGGHKSLVFLQLRHLSFTSPVIKL